ncbi:MAG: hypothetical protein EU532_08835 [Promethearchaeota archaeon]|nr:MAG: hypothetical protein EU532_08835 [Candidatus Lokiarchaeota archaeon]
MSKNTSRKTLIRIMLLIAQCVAFILFYFISFLGNILFFLILVIGSVVVLSTGTIYTVIHHESMDDKITGKKPFISKIKALEKRRMLLQEEETADFIEVYMSEMPSIQKYVDSEKSYEEMPIIEDFIFTELSPKELAQINRLGLTDNDKKQFIGELLYFTPEERSNLINSMIENQNKIDKELVYIPPMSIEKETKTIRVYTISLIEPGEKKKIINIELTEYIHVIKDQVAQMFDYNVGDFLLSTGGIIMNEDALIKEYKIEDKDEIVLIPSRIPKK